MDTNSLFTVALGLTPPWRVAAVRFDKAAEGGRGRLDLEIDFSRGGRFPCSACGTECAVHDTREKEWRHLDFFQHLAYLKARVPRTDCMEHGVRLVEVPWARAGSGFTLLFEAYVMLMGAEMPIAALSRSVGEHDTRLWRILKEYVAEARSRVDMSGVEALIVDETSVAKRHRYLTLFAEPGVEKGRVLFATLGASHKTFHRFKEDFVAHGGCPEKVRDLCMDMSFAFRKGAGEVLPDAAITFDRFHVMKLAADGVDEVRRREVSQRPELRRTRFDWLHNPENLSETRSARIATLSQLDLKTATAYHLKMTLRTLWEMPSVKRASRFLSDWIRWARQVCGRESPEKPNGLEPMLKAVETIAYSRRGILNYFRKRLTTAVLEGINSLVQAARARARGYTNPDTFITMIYLIAGRLDFRLPVLTHTI